MNPTDIEIEENLPHIEAAYAVDQVEKAIEEVAERPPVVTVSLIGRPNVGKSSLFNRFIDFNKRSLTYDIPGVTRDKHYGVVKLEKDNGEEVSTILVDTGGLSLVENNAFKNEMSKEEAMLTVLIDQAEQAIDESDLVLLVVDVREGILPLEQKIAELIRRKHKNFWVVANKFDTEKQRGDESDFYALGINTEDLFTVSASHGRGVSLLKEALVLKVEEIQKEKKDAVLQDHDYIMPKHKVISNVAIIGAPNAGKSTLLNNLLQKKRATVSPIPGTTVDPINAYFEMDFGKKWEQLTGHRNQSLHIVDTAGIRKKSKVKGAIEGLSVFKALKSIEAADVVILLADATKGISHQDRRLIDISLERGKSVMIGLNKIDLVLEDMTPSGYKNWLLDLEAKFPWAKSLTVVPFSAMTSKNLEDLKTVLKRTIIARNRPISTGELNNALNELMERNSIGLPGAQGQRLKLKYATCIKTDPPTILMFVNKFKNIPDHYKRYLKNGLREKFRLENTPIHLIFRSNQDRH
jgi:GTPase